MTEARSVILVTESWLTGCRKGYYTPLYAVINLFVSILQNLACATPSDLALMDVGAGHFARLSFATESDFNVPLVKNLALLANNALEVYKTIQPSQTSTLGQLDNDGSSFLSVAPPFVTAPEGVPGSFSEEHLHQDVSEYLQTLKTQRLLIR